MTESLFQNSDLDQAIVALKKDLLAEGGPSISTMRNYNFAIVPYRPSDEFKVRQKVRQLSDELKAEGWGVLSISLQKLMLDRIRNLGEDVIGSLVERERRLFEKDPARGLNHLRSKVEPEIEGPEGLAANVTRLIGDFADRHPNLVDRTVIFIGRAGSLYPFLRTSALLKHIDGKTRNIPVVLLYPGDRRDVSALSFMGELDADRDYRPRIYP
ncbi:MAG: DUF1788 domain-containing protein [Deltaproteobacteria bacterium]|nr:DUF1788 domain-containing protein [Deltaproteobacteria bacterium]